MDEQPVALATSIRSPNSCVASLMYGVSPQPEHAPENSNNGCKSCEFLIAARFRLALSTSGSSRKNSQLSFSRARMGGCGAILMALWPTCRLSFTGQASTHSPQPVQSSGETWSVYFMPGNSLKCASVERKVSGAPASLLVSNTFSRMTACGQTMTHLPH